MIMISFVLDSLSTHKHFYRDALLIIAQLNLTGLYREQLLYRIL